MSLRAALLVLLGSTLLAACAPPREPSVAPGPTVEARHRGHGERLAADPRVGRYTSSAWGFSTVSYWIEGDEGVVLVDTQFLPSAAEELVEIAERETGKPVVAAVVLHANPDKFNGTAVMQARGIEVLSSDPVRALIPGVHAKRLAAFGERYAPDYPAEAARPSGFGEASTTLHLAGLELRAEVLGPGCSEAHVALQWEGHLFVGDLVANGTHSWLELGHGDAWRQRIDELSALRPRFVHPGRGASGGPELLEAQRAYLERVQALVVAEHGAMQAAGLEPTRSRVQAALARVRRELEHEYPEHRFAVFLDIGLPAEWRRVTAAGSGGRERVGPHEAVGQIDDEGV
ncbi:MAG: MBL fold metallo-hydrolase [Myxococcales bacterium]|nr:MBL fold metallo-hydrolase [Myxococcales bacterium]